MKAARAPRKGTGRIMVLLTPEALDFAIYCICGMLVQMISQMNKTPHCKVRFKNP